MTRKKLRLLALLAIGMLAWLLPASAWAGGWTKNLALTFDPSALYSINEAIAQIVITLQFSFWALFLHLYEPISL